MNNFLQNSQNLKKVVQYLIYATAITPIIVFGNFLFPYISTRTVYFRSLTEVSVIIFLLIIVLFKFKKSKQKNYFLYIFGAFVIVNIISAFFSSSIFIAWFSDIERMWGVFTLIHLFLFYFLLRSFFKGKEWRIFLNISLAIGLIVAFYGLAQYYPEVFKLNVFQAGKGRIISTLGNSAYVAIYMLFSMFFATFLFTKTNNNWLKLYYAGAVIILFQAFNLASIRGATLGLLAGLTISALLYILLGKNKKIKIGISLALIIIPLFLFFALLNPTNRFVQSNSLLNRISSISLHDSTVETRYIGWSAAWQGFKEHPILGVGMDNFHVVFNKYFDSDYYLYAPSEPYFDRSHNAILDVLVMNGIVGFIIFLCLPGFIGYYLIKGYRQNKIKLDEFLIFSALTVAYFIHLIFVFDDLNSYMYFVVLISFVEYRFYKNTIIEISDEKQPKQLMPIISVVIIFILVIGYNYNIKVIKACNATVESLKYGNDLEKTITSFKKALDYDIAPSRNVTLTYVNYITGLGGQLQEIASNQKSLEILRKGIIEVGIALDKEIKKDSYNAMLYSRKAILNNIAYLLSRDPNYINIAIKSNEKAIELSKEHLQYYYGLADSYIISNRPAEAIKVVQDSLVINDKYKDGYFHLARTYLANNEIDQAFKTAKIFTRLGHNVNTDRFFDMLIQKYKDNNNQVGVIDTLELAYKNNNKNPQTILRLIKINLENKNNKRAMEFVDKLGKIEQHQRDAQYLIQQIKAGNELELIQQLERK